LLSGALYLPKTFPQGVSWQLDLDVFSQCFTLFTLLLEIGFNLIFVAQVVPNDGVNVCDSKRL
jgi:hypothetical protein